eukprot:scaffold139840_cov36-Tisochrysis_lutea.AAC.1
MFRQPQEHTRPLTRSRRCRRLVAVGAAIGNQAAAAMAMCTSWPAPPRERHTRRHSRDRLPPPPHTPTPTHKSSRASGGVHTNIRKFRRAMHPRRGSGEDGRSPRLRRCTRARKIPSEIPRRYLPFGCSKFAHRDSAWQVQRGEILRFSSAPMGWDDATPRPLGLLT